MPGASFETRRAQRPRRTPQSIHFMSFICSISSETSSKEREKYTSQYRLCGGLCVLCDLCVEKPLRRPVPLKLTRVEVVEFPSDPIWRRENMRLTRRSNFVLTRALSAHNSGVRRRNCQRCNPSILKPCSSKSSANRGLTDRTLESTLWALPSLPAAKNVSTRRRRL